MLKYMVFMVKLAILVVVSEADPTVANKEGLPKSFPLNSTLDNHSHEEFHLKNHPDTSIQTNNNNNKSINVVNLKPEDHSTNNSDSSLHQLDVKVVTKSDLSVNSTHINISTPKHEKVTFAEGGVEASSPYHLNNKANGTNKNISTVSTVTTQPSVTSTIVSVPIHVTTPGVNSTQIHKRIHGRPGVSEIVTPISTNKPSSTTTTRPRKKKPLFTVITGDKESKDSESFIESPTTGRDYVLPIVLIILSLPIVGYLIKIIYRRGTEFTERQQYHRMYLIDGMYNSR